MRNCHLPDLIRQCSISRDLERGRHLHAYVLSSTTQRHDRFIGNLLVDMYGKCGSVSDAWETFVGISERNVFSWNALLTVYAQNGHISACRQCFARMPELDSISWNIYFGMFLRSHSILDTRQMFNAMPEPDSSSWILMIQANARAGELFEAVSLFDAMPRKNHVAWTCIASVLSDAGEIDESIRGFLLMPQHNVIAGTVFLSTVAMADSVDSVIDAKVFFDQMPEKNCLTWMSLLQGWSQRSNAYIDDCHDLFLKMPQHDTVSATAMAAALARSGRFRDGEELLIAMPGRDLASWSTLVSVYGKDGRVDPAKQAFDKMPMHDIASWTTMIESFLRHPGDVAVAAPIGHDLAAMIDEQRCCNRLSIILDEARRDSLASSVAIALLAGCDRLPQAIDLFVACSPRDAINWAAMVAAFAARSLEHEAIETFSRMPMHDPVAWNTIMAMRSENPRGLDLAAVMFDRMPHRNVVSWNVMSQGYGKSDLRRALSWFHRIPQWDLCSWTGIVVASAGAGEIGSAREIFEEMPRQDLVSWNAIIAGYVRVGERNLAREMLARMKLEGNPSSASTYTAILAGCCYIGAMEDGRRFFAAMAGDDAIQPGIDHYSCMIELLGRGKKLDEAEEMMPFAAPAVAWTTLLAACKIHGDAARAARAMEKVVEVDPGIASAYSVYACAGV